MTGFQETLKWALKYNSKYILKIVKKNLIMITSFLSFIFFSGPYWTLLGSGVKYLDFYVHVTKMYDALQAWHMDASDLL